MRNHAIVGHNLGMSVKRKIMKEICCCCCCSSSSSYMFVCISGIHIVFVEVIIIEQFYDMRVVHEERRNPDIGSI